MFEWASQFLEVTLVIIALGIASFIFLRIEGPAIQGNEGVFNEWREANDEPRPMSFFQFQSPKSSSSVSQQWPGPMFFVLKAAGLRFAYACLGSSPSVLPTPLVQLNEKDHWHEATCAGRWNFGTRNVTSWSRKFNCNEGGILFILWDNFLCHWHAMSYETFRTVASVCCMADANA